MLQHVVDRVESERGQITLKRKIACNRDNGDGMWADGHSDNGTREDDLASGRKCITQPRPTRCETQGARNAELDLGQ